MKTAGHESDEAVLALYERASGTHRQLTPELDLSVQRLTWAADSRSLFFAARDHGRSRVYSVDLEGTVRRLTSEG